MTRKYRTHSPSLKFKIAIEAIKNEKTVNQIASEFEVSPSQIIEWKKQFLAEGTSIFQGKKPAKKTEAHEDVELLQQQVGKLTLQVDWLKKKLSSTS